MTASQNNPMHKRSVFIVAEISANHGQNLNRAIKMIRVAKECGADAVKFQTYTPDTITIDVRNKYFTIKHPKWGGQTLYQLYQKAYTPWGWFKKLKQISDDQGMAFFSTAFDTTAVDFLEDIGVFCHKVASFELVDLPLIAYMAKKRKPLILSTGMATLPEIREAVTTAKKAGAKDITLLKCVSSYPAKPKEMNLRTIPDLRKRFQLPVGLSDHTLGIGTAVTAAALGASFIEKHFTLSRELKTPDSFFSMEPQELKDLVDNVRMAEAALGNIHYGLTDDEKKSRIFRRSLFMVENVKKGEAFTLRNVRSVRPSNGLAPKYLSVVLRSCAIQDIPRGTPLTLKHLKLVP